MDLENKIDKNKILDKKHLIDDIKLQNEGDKHDENLKLELLHSSLALFAGNHAQHWLQHHQPRQPPLAHGQFALTFQLPQPFVCATCLISYSPPDIVANTNKIYCHIFELNRWPENY